MSLSHHHNFGAMQEEIEPRSLIQTNAKRVSELHNRIHETFKKGTRAEWSHARADFHSQYDALAFPGSYAPALKKIQAGDTRTIDYALAFLEIRPYFFRSQYIRTKLTRLLKQATLTPRQSERLQRAMEAENRKKARTTLA